MSSVDPKMVARAQQCADAVIKRLNEYLSIRFDQAIRINPRIKTLKQDLLYHEMESVRTCLMGEKIYGTLRLVVANVIMSDDDRKRRALLSPSDQTSIQVELVSHVREDVKQSTRGQVRIHDLKTFYAAINPDLTDLIDLIETWIWWDISDAAELARLDQKMNVIQMLRQGRGTPELRKHYGAMIIPPSGKTSEEKTEHVEVTDEEIIAFEFSKLEEIRDHWKARRQDDHGYMFVLQRDALAPANHADTLSTIVELALEHDHLDSVAELDEPTRGIYSPKLKLPAEKVSRQGALDWIRARLVEAGRELAKTADGEPTLGPPYRYKLRQSELIEKRLRDLKAQIKSMLPEPPRRPPKSTRKRRRGAASGSSVARRAVLDMESPGNFW